MLRIQVWALREALAGLREEDEIVMPDDVIDTIKWVLDRTTIAGQPVAQGALQRARRKRPTS